MQWNLPPKQTVQQRIAMMREFSIDESKLRQITQPVLLIGSQKDFILPSVEEVKRLAKIFPSSHCCDSTPIAVMLVW